MAAALAHQAIGVWLENLHHVHRSAAVGFQVARHGPHAAAGDRRRVEARALQVVLEGHPRRRHVAGRRDAQADEIAPAERAVALAPDQQKRVAPHHLPEADQRAARVGVVMIITRIGPPQDTSTLPSRSAVAVRAVLGETTWWMSSPSLSQ